MLIASVSWGNDSVALLQWLHEHNALTRFERALCVYMDTGWAAKDWMERVERAEALARSYGFEPHRAQSIGFMPLARLKKAFPRNGMQFCTEELKIKPFVVFADAIDPDHEATIAVGIRREESEERSQWPEHIENSERHGGRDAWFPLVRVAERERETNCSVVPASSRSRTGPESVSPASILIATTSGCSPRTASPRSRRARRKWASPVRASHAPYSGPIGTAARSAFARSFDGPTAPAASTCRSARRAIRGFAEADA